MICSCLGKCDAKSYLSLIHNVCETDADRRENARITVHEDGVHAQCTCDGTCMLTACTTEARQHVRCNIVPLYEQGHTLGSTCVYTIVGSMAGR